MIIKLLSKSKLFSEIVTNNLKSIGINVETISTDDSLKEQLKEVEVIINDSFKIDKSIIDSSPNLRVIHQSGIGIDNIDVNYCTSKSIFVANVPLANAISVAEHTLFLMLLMAKNVRDNNDGTSLTKKRIQNLIGSELHGKRLTIVGLGATGIEVAKRARVFGMKISGVTKPPFSRKGLDKTYYVDNIDEPDKLIQHLVESDYVSIHTPLNDETRDMFSERELGLMKKTAFLINVARAPIVNKKALFDVLDQREIQGAAFDVFWEEPPNKDDKLLSLNNFILTPHIAGWTSEAIDSSVRIISNNILRTVNGENPLTIVNSDLL